MQKSAVQAATECVARISKATIQNCILGKHNTHTLIKYFSLWFTCRTGCAILAFKQLRCTSYNLNPQSHEEHSKKGEDGAGQNSTLVIPSSGGCSSSNSSFKGMIIAITLPVAELQFKGHVENSAIRVQRPRSKRLM